MGLSEMLPAVGEKKKKKKKKKAKDVEQVVDMSFLEEIGGDGEAEDLEREIQERKRLRDDDVGVRGTGLAALLPAPKKRARETFDDVDKGRTTEFEVRENLNVGDEKPAEMRSEENPKKKLAKVKGLQSLLAYGSDDDESGHEHEEDEPATEVITSLMPDESQSSSPPPPKPTSLTPVNTKPRTGPVTIKRAQFTFKNRKAPEPVEERQAVSKGEEGSEKAKEDEEAARAAWTKYYEDLAEYKQRMQEEADVQTGVIAVNQDAKLAEYREKLNVPGQEQARNYTTTLGNATTAPNHIMHLAQQAVAQRNEVANANEQFRSVRGRAKAQYGF